MSAPIRFLMLACGALVLAVVLGIRNQAPLDPAASHPLPSFTIPEPSADHQICFVLGDMGTGRPDQRRVAGVMAKRARAGGLDFLITVGDNFYPAGVETPDDPAFRSRFEQVYDDPVLSVPVYPTLGNHDHGGDPEAQVAYSERNPRWRMPARYYAFTRALEGGVTYDFFALDTTPLDDEDRAAAAQINWLEQQLAKSRARWKIVYGHHPLYSSGDHGGSRSVREALEALLIEHHVDLYLAGHDHHLELQAPRSGVLYAVAGAAGGPDMAYPVRWADDSLYAATGGGLLLMRLEADSLLLEFIRMDGLTQYAHVLRK